MGHIVQIVLLTNFFLMVDFAESENGACTYRGTIHPHLATFKHENRCSKLQCQFGQVVVTYPACGTDLDGTCHPLGHLFEYNNLTYQCQNMSKPIDAGPFRYKKTMVYAPGCITPVGNFVSPSRGWEVFRMNPCGGYQCQNGHVVQLDQICQTGFQDTPCRLVGEQFLKENVILECTATQVNGTTTYQNKVVYPKPFKGKTCFLNNKTIGHLAVRNDLLTCREYQCRNGTLKLLKIKCRNAGGDRQCLMIGERYFSISINAWRQCVLDPETGEPLIVVTKDVYKRCQLTSLVWLNHLEQGISPDGCSRVQCQNGVLVELEAGCYSEAQLRCYDYKLIWKQKNKMKTCGLSPSATIVDISRGETISEPPGEWKKINGTR